MQTHASSKRGLPTGFRERAQPDSLLAHFSLRQRVRGMCACGRFFAPRKELSRGHLLTNT